jgi:Polyketide cyclase / dehydrase and lipid transport
MSDPDARRHSIRAVRDSVTVHMKASPEDIWPLVSDVVTNARRFAAETFDAEWLGGATGPAVGVRFRGHVKRNGRKLTTYWSVCEIDTCVPNRDFAFSACVAGRPLNRWRYQLEPNGDGTDVTESFELQNLLPLRLYWAVVGRARGKTNVDNMRTTLARIKAAVEAA